MGFVFNLFVGYIFLPILGFLFLSLIITRKKMFAKTLGLMLGGIIIVVAIGMLLNWLTSKKTLRKEDYYGSYIIDRNFFKGKQADWQYETYRFEITSDDSIFFYITKQDKVINTYTGNVKMIYPHGSCRLIIYMNDQVLLC